MIRFMSKILSINYLQIQHMHIPNAVSPNRNPTNWEKVITLPHKTQAMKHPINIE